MAIDTDGKRWFWLCLAIVFSACLHHAGEDSSQVSQTDSWAFSHFDKVDRLNPILQPSSDLTFRDPITGTDVKWEERNVLNPTAVVRDGQIYLLYRAQDRHGTSRIGLATSSDGLHFSKRAEPVFYPDRDKMRRYEWNLSKSEDWRGTIDTCKTCYFDGVEDPRIIESENGVYFMTYTAYDGKTARLCIASSVDLLDWTKHGLAFKDEKYRDIWSKSGAIVAEIAGERVVAKKIDGKYWMYFGDTNLYIATSENLEDWDILTDEESTNMISVLHPRKGFFDSRLVEPGPYALLGEGGISMIYNSSNAANYNSVDLPKFTYAAGQALFDKEAPFKLLDRTREHFIYPDKDYEKVGEVNDVCFVEGLVYFNEKWFLYYGTADSKIAVATH